MVGEDAQIEHSVEKQQGSKWGVGASVAAEHGVEEDDVWLGNLVEQVLGIVHGGGGGAERAGIDELGEDGKVMLEVGFDGSGVYLLEFSDGSESVESVKSVKEEQGKIGIGV